MENKKKTIKQLEQELKEMTADRDTSMFMYRDFLKQSIQRGKAVDVLMPMVNTEELNEALSELYDLRTEVTRLKGQKKFLIWQQDNPGKGFCEYLWSLGDFKPSLSGKKDKEVDKSE